MDTNVKENKKGKNLLIVALCVLIVAAAVFALVHFLKDNKDGVAIEYKDPNGNVTANVDRNFMSLMTAIMNYQLGADVLDEESWNTVAGNDGKTVKDYVMETAVDYAEMLLKSEYLFDYVYAIGFSDAQKEDVDKFIADIASVYGSQEALENYLSAFGTNIKSLRRFMELSMKQKTVLEYLLATVTEEQIKTAFEENYYVADHIMIKLEGALKDDGTIMPLTDEERAQKIGLAKEIYNQIAAGAKDFYAALYEYGEDTYPIAFPNGYFIPKNGNSNLDEKVINEIRMMKENDIRYVETDSAVFIVRKNKTDGDFCLASGDFTAMLASSLAQEKFWQECASLDGTVVYQQVISELDPSAIASFNIDELGQ